MKNSSTLALSIGAVMFAAGLSLAGWAEATVSGEAPKGQVTGIGGIFIKAKEPAKLGAWYREHLGIVSGPGGKIFLWRDHDAPDTEGQTVWSLFPQTTDYFGRADQQVMINYRVDDLDALLARLKSEGVEQAGKTQTFDYGKFAWVIDGEGNRVELWQPIDPAHKP